MMKNIKYYVLFLFVCLCSFGIGKYIAQLGVDHYYSKILRMDVWYSKSVDKYDQYDLEPFLDMLNYIDANDYDNANNIIIKELEHRLLRAKKRCNIITNSESKKNYQEYLRKVEDSMNDINRKKSQ